MNPNRYPAGNSKGGQFAPKNSGLSPEVKQSLSKKSKTKKRLENLEMKNISSKLDGKIDNDLNSLYHAIKHGHAKMVSKKNLNRVKATLEDPDFVYKGDNGWNCYYKKYSGITKRYDYVKVVVNPKKKRVVTFFGAKITEEGKDKLYEKQ